MSELELGAAGRLYVEAFSLTNNLLANGTAEDATRDAELRRAELLMKLSEERATADFTAVVLYDSSEHDTQHTQREDLLALQANPDNAPIKDLIEAELAKLPAVPEYDRETRSLANYLLSALGKMPLTAVGLVETATDSDMQKVLPEKHVFEPAKSTDGNKQSDHTENPSLHADTESGIEHDGPFKLVTGDVIPGVFGILIRKLLAASKEQPFTTEDLMEILSDEDVARRKNGTNRILSSYIGSLRNMLFRYQADTAYVVHSVAQPSKKTAGRPIKQYWMEELPYDAEKQKSINDTYIAAGYLLSRSDLFERLGLPVLSTDTLDAFSKVVPEALVRTKDDLVKMTGRATAQALLEACGDEFFMEALFDSAKSDPRLLIVDYLDRIEENQQLIMLAALGAELTIIEEPDGRHYLYDIEGSELIDIIYPHPISPDTSDLSAQDTDPSAVIPDINSNNGVKPAETHGEELKTIQDIIDCAPMSSKVRQVVNNLRPEIEAVASSLAGEGYMAGDTIPVPTLHVLFPSLDKERIATQNLYYRRSKSASIPAVEIPSMLWGKNDSTVIKLATLDETTRQDVLDITDALLVHLINYFLEVKKSRSA